MHNLADLTTAQLLTMESAAGIMTSGALPPGLTRDSDIREWFRIMPNVDQNLLSRWASLVRAQAFLKDQIRNLEQDANGCPF
jgi:hypothetical protein